MNDEDFAEVSLKQMEAILVYLPLFKQPGLKFGSWQQYGFAFSQQANAFIETLYAQNFVIQFDWPGWKDVGQQYIAYPQALASADLLTLRKLLTAHVRSDRFSEGHLAAMFDNGHLTAILQRVQQIYNQIAALQGLDNTPVVPAKVRGPAQQPSRPDKNTYWLIPGKLLAGEYSGHYTDAAAREKINRFLDAGVNFFINLTQLHELRPYDQIVQHEAAKRGLTVEHRRLSIEDMNIPDPQHMAAILDTIDSAVAAGHTVYVHCWGGIGRTGTVIGCYLVRHGMTGDEALHEIARLWQNMAKRNIFPHSPQTQTQIDYVRHWTQPDTP